MYFLKAVFEIVFELGLVQKKGWVARVLGHKIEMTSKDTSFDEPQSKYKWHRCVFLTYHQGPHNIDI